MVARVWESNRGRRGGAQSFTTEFRVRGAADENDARQQLILNIPTTIDGLEGVPFDVDFESITLTDRPRDGVYYFDCTYISPTGGAPGAEVIERERLQPGEWTFSFDTSGRTENIRQSLVTRAYDSGGREPALDDVFNNAINVRGFGPEAQVLGADRVVPSLRFQITIRHPRGSITTGYAGKIADLTGAVNDSDFPPGATDEFGMPFVTRQWLPGEVMFLGLTGSYSSDMVIDFTFMFEVKPHQFQPRTIGVCPDVIWEGHDVVWEYYAPNIPGTINRVVPQAVHVFVEEIAEKKDLRELFRSQ